MAVVEIVEASVPSALRRLEEFIPRIQEAQSYPIRFSGVAEQFNFLCTLHALNFGKVSPQFDCFYGVQWDPLRAMLSAHICGHTLAQDFYINASKTSLATLYGVSLDKDFELQPGIYTTKPSDESYYITLVADTLLELGTQLFKLGASDFYELYEADPANFQARMASLSVFKDSVLVNDEQVVLSCKLYNLLQHLIKELGDKVAFTDLDIGCRTDALSIAALRELGLVKVTGNLTKNEAQVRLACKTAAEKLVSVDMDVATLTRCLWMFSLSEGVSTKPHEPESPTILF